MSDSRACACQQLLRAQGQPFQLKEGGIKLESKPCSFADMTLKPTSLLCTLAHQNTDAAISIAKQQNIIPCEKSESSSNRGKRCKCGSGILGTLKGLNRQVLAVRPANLIQTKMCSGRYMKMRNCNQQNVVSCEQCWVYWNMGGSTSG